mgnify:CR=1 FL=1|tara:strand:+ start:1206 stop:1514 length:309 start_codon:yes stop_codon:yes gene_type:complete
MRAKKRFSGSVELTWNNEHIINEHQIVCTIGENEFNVSQNPTISTDNSGSLRGFATASFFEPYVTTIGLYNDVNQLLAVAKLAQSIPLSSTTDTNFIIRYDS